jgi:cytochrome c2
MQIADLRSLAALILWHVAGLVATVGILGQLAIQRSLTDMRADQLTFLAALSAAFAFSAMVNIWWLRRRSQTYSILRLLVLVLGAFGVSALGLVLLQTSYASRSVVVATIVLTPILLALARWVRPLWLGATAVVVLAGSAAVQTRMDRIVEIRPKPQRIVAAVETRYLPLTATYYDNYFPNCDPETGVCDFTPRIGGAISTLSSGYLLATGEGLMYYFTRDSRRALTATRLPYVVPLNDAEFARIEQPPSVRVFRVTDILVEEQGAEAAIYAAHHFYNKNADCVVIRLSVMRGASAAIAAGTAQQRWDTIYETKPCMPRHPGPRSPMFVGNESGGRLARLDASTLLMTVGDHNFDGWNSETIAAQDLESDYGKTLAIDLQRRSASVFTFGHRNPQGLYVARNGEIWSTEHGPAGGDELNRLVRGTNYGWPLVSYGTQYGERTWPVSKTPNDHRGFQQPVYSWVPSIAVSNLIGVEKNRFPFWQGDLLIGSFGESLLRGRIREGRVVTLEPVRLREGGRGRIRDLLEDRDGAIVIWFDGGAIAFLEPASDAATNVQVDAARGQTLFGACAGCHELQDGATHKLGPDLAGLLGRRVADRNGFPYSAALTHAGGRWTEERLDRFLANPQEFAPGNTMQFSGLTNPADRAELIEYLKGVERRPRQ